jgi:hypothetical protein
VSHALEIQYPCNTFGQYIFITQPLSCFVFIHPKFYSFKLLFTHPFFLRCPPSKIMTGPLVLCFAVRFCVFSGKFNNDVIKGVSSDYQFRFFSEKRPSRKQSWQNFTSTYFRFVVFVFISVIRFGKVLCTVVRFLCDIVQYSIARITASGFYKTTPRSLSTRCVRTSCSSGTSGYHPATRLLRPADLQQVVPISLISFARNKLTTTSL